MNIEIMDISKVMADLTFEIYSDQEFKGEYLNPFILYEDEFNGNLLDIGCGQSPVILSMLGSELNLYGIDQDPKQIEYLLTRVERLSPGRVVETYSASFAPEIFKEIKFNYIVLENVLHLVQEIPDPLVFLESVEKVMAPNARILIQVHTGGEDSDHFRFF